MSRIIAYNTKELDLLARLMRAEAIGEGDYGMLMVGNVGVNRVLADCLTFDDIRSITSMVYQNPGGFSGPDSQLFISAATTKEKELAEKVLSGKSYYPATNALWFYAPSGDQNCVGLWYEQRFVGKYKNHCFYIPYEGVCPQVF